MRIISFLCLCILFASFGQAQEDDNLKRYFTGASLHLSYQKNYIPPTAYTPLSTIYGTYSNGTSDNEFIRSSVYALYGKQYNRYWAMGGFLILGFEKNLYRGIFVSSSSTSLSQYDERVQNYGAGIFARYILNPDNILQAFIQPSLSYRLNKRSIVRDSNFSDDINVNSFEFASRLGFLYELNESFRLNISIGSFYVLYGQWNGRSGDHDNFFTMGTNFNFNSLQFGGEYMF